MRVCINRSDVTKKRQLRYILKPQEEGITVGNYETGGLSSKSLLIIFIILKMLDNRLKKSWDMFTCCKTFILLVYFRVTKKFAVLFPRFLPCSPPHHRRQTGERT